MCTSVPQMPARCTRIRTSLMPMRGFSTSSSHSPGSFLLLTSAFISLVKAYCSRVTMAQSLLLMEPGARRLGREHLAFIVVHQVEIHSPDGTVVRDNAGPEEVSLARFRRQTAGRHRRHGHPERTRLPVDAQMVLAAAIRADPGAIQPHSDSGPADLVRGVVELLDHVDRPTAWKRCSGTGGEGWNASWRKMWGAAGRSAAARAAASSRTAGAARARRLTTSSWRRAGMASRSPSITAWPPFRHIPARI